MAILSKSHASRTNYESKPFIPLAIAIVVSVVISGTACENMKYITLQLLIPSFDIQN